MGIFTNYIQNINPYIYKQVQLLQTIKDNYCLLQTKIITESQTNKEFKNKNCVASSQMKYNFQTTLTPNDQKSLWNMGQEESKKEREDFVLRVYLLEISKRLHPWTIITMTA